MQLLSGIPWETRVFSSNMDPISVDPGNTGTSMKWGQVCYLLQSIWTVLECFAYNVPTGCLESCQ